MRTSIFNPNGCEMSHATMHVPVAYMLSHPTQRKGANLVVVDIAKKTVAYSFKGPNSYTIGTVRRVPKLKDRRGSFFMVDGKRVDLRSGSYVM